MKIHPLISILLLALTILAVGCGKGWQVDYGNPAAQFLQEDLVSQGSNYIGEKITVKGTVQKVDVSDSNASEVHLEGGIVCKYGKMSAMAEALKVGDTVYVDGILEKCEEGNIVLSPASSRAPDAPFDPKGKE